MRRFINRAKPAVAIIMETELWPNLFNQCRRRGIPVVLASARLSPKSVMRYRRFGALFRPCIVRRTRSWRRRTRRTADRFVAIGADPARTRVAGNVKFDVGIDPAVLQRGLVRCGSAKATRRQKSTKSCLLVPAAGVDIDRRCLRSCANSHRRQRHPMGIDPAVLQRGLALRSAWATRPGHGLPGALTRARKEMVLTAHAAVLADAPDALLLLVPRHPERFQSVADLLGRRGFRYERRTTSGGLGPGGCVAPRQPGSAGGHGGRNCEDSAMYARPWTWPSSAEVWSPWEVIICWLAGRAGRAGDHRVLIHSEHPGGLRSCCLQSGGAVESGRCGGSRRRAEAAV